MTYDGPRVRVSLSFLAGVLGLAAVAAAVTVHEIRAGDDVLTGTIDAPAAVDRLPIRLVEGSSLSLKLAAAKGSALRLDFDLLGTDRAPAPGLSGSVKASTKGNKIVLKKWAVQDSGLHWIEIRGMDGTLGDWSLTSKVKLPKKHAATATAGAEATVELPFVCPGNATGVLAVKAAKKSAAIPSFDSLLDPEGKPLLVDDIRPSKTGFTAANVVLARAGTYRLFVSAAAAGDLAFKAKWKIAKSSKRSLRDVDVVTDPVVTGVTPAGGTTADVVALDVTGDFFQSGATLRLARGTTVVTVPATAVTVADGHATCTLNLAPFTKGLYDVAVTNPDGGTHGLEDVFSIENAAARPTTVFPTSATDTGVQRLTVTGTFLLSGATLRLERGGETIPGVGVAGGGGQLYADFDLDDVTLGDWDVVVANPDAADARLEGAFTVLNAPPAVTSMDPTRNLVSDAFTATLVVGEVEDGAQVRLRRTGHADVAATNVTLVSDIELTADLDVSGSAIGPWDLVVTNPDGQSATLAGVFYCIGDLTPPAEAFQPGGSVDGPPAACWNDDRNEMLVAWIETDTGGTSWKVMARRLDYDGTTLGSAVSVSDGADSIPKKQVAVGWDSTNGEFLVAWAEQRLVTLTGSSHPSGSGSLNLYTIMAQRLAGTNLTDQGSNVQMSDHVLGVSTWYIDEFNNTRPSVVWDPSSAVWQIAWMQEWDTSGRYSYDDYDVLLRELDPQDASGKPGNLTNVATNPYHEGDPFLLWDPVGDTLIMAMNARSGSDSAPLDIWIGGTVLAKGSGADLADPRIVLDADADRLLVTWTNVPTSGADRTIEAVVSERSNPATAVGSVTTLGSGNGHHFVARSAWNPALGECLVAWTRSSASGMTARWQRVDAGDTAGLKLVGSAAQLSGSSTDEGLPVLLVEDVEDASVAIWLKTLSLDSGATDPGAAVSGGIWRGDEVWFRRFQ